MGDSTSGARDQAGGAIMARMSQDRSPLRHLAFSILWHLGETFTSEDMDRVELILAAERAVLSKPRCDRCAHWDQSGRIRGDGWCNRMREPDSKASAEMYDGVIT